MGGYAINDRKGAKEAIQILDKLSFPQDQPWRYDPHFVIATEKGKKKPGPQDHEHRPIEQRLANKELWEEVEAIVKSDADPAQTLAQAFPEPQPKKPGVPVYYTFYRPKDVVVPKEHMKFTALTEERRK
jgi:hypothetical protein